jgi:hypothetical protein
MKKTKKNEKNILKINPVQFYVFITLIFVVGIAAAYMSATLAYNSYMNPAGKESASTQIKEIVANTTSCCFTQLGCIDTVGYDNMTILTQGDYCVAKNLYKWAAENINYTHQSGYLSPEETLKIGSGDCADMSILYCSLAKQAMLDCNYVKTGNHMFSYVVINKGKEYENVIMVDLANKDFRVIYP